MWPFGPLVILNHPLSETSPFKNIQISRWTSIVKTILPVPDLPPYRTEMKYVRGGLLGICFLSSYVEKLWNSVRKCQKFEKLKNESLQNCLLETPWLMCTAKLLLTRKTGFRVFGWGLELPNHFVLHQANFASCIGTNAREIYSRIILHNL